jgi:protein gp37
MDFFEDAPGPNEWRADLWRLIRQTKWLDWQILTKRPENIERMLPDEWGDNRWGYWPNVWLGTSIEDNRYAHRADILATVPAKIHFVSYEPAIGPGDEIPLKDVQWLICGGESGPGYRRMDLNWAHDIWARCEDAGVPFFFKQDSGSRTEMGIDALGQIVREYPQGWDRRS